jgi:hypothetical protein
VGSLKETVEQIMMLHEPWCRRRSSAASPKALACGHGWRPTEGGRAKSITDLAERDVS